MRIIARCIVVLIVFIPAFPFLLILDWVMDKDNKSLKDCYIDICDFVKSELGVNNG